MKVRNQKPEYVVKKGRKTFKYAEDEDGNLRIVEADGLKESPLTPRTITKC